MTGFTVGEIARVTGAVLHGGGAETPVNGAVIDSRAAGPGIMFCALRGERQDGHDYIASALERGAACALAARVPDGAAGSVLVVSDVAAAMAALARECRARFTGPLVGIVGSSGKTTTKEICACVLSERFSTLRTEGNLNNELGVPLTLFRLDAGTEAAVVELGISDFGEMTRLGRMAKPDIAVYTLIGRSHLNALHDLDGVLRAKSELLEEMAPDALVIANGDDTYLNRLRPSQRLLRYGLSSGCDVRAENIRYSGGVSFEAVRGERRINVTVPAFGRHLVYAALAAVCVGTELGLSDGEIAAGLLKYAPVGRRANIIQTNSLTIVDDCYNSNPDSCIMSIASASDFGGRLVCVLGDMLNLGPDSDKMHREVGDAARAHGALLLTSGEAAKAMGGIHFSTRGELTAALPEYLRPGDTVLVKASHAMEFENITEALKKLDI